MILNITKKELDGMKIGHRETVMLSVLANNCCNSRDELEKYVFGDKWINAKNDVYNTIHRLRKRGLHIESQSNNGFRLIETIYIDY